MTPILWPEVHLLNSFLDGNHFAQLSTARNTLAPLSTLLKHSCFCESTEVTFILLFVFMPGRFLMASPGNRVVKDAGLRPLA